MDIRVFRTFLEVSKVKHFGKAAENLYITQAAVSARIKQLESYYNVLLFIRDKNNIRLTSAGEKLLPHAQAIVEQLELSKLTIIASETHQVLVNLAATPNMWDTYIADAIPIINQQTGVVFNAEISVREMIHRKLLEKTLDVAILPDPIRDDELLNKEIGQFELKLVSTEPLEITQLHHYVLVDWGIHFFKQNKLLKHLEPVFRTTNAKMALDFLLKTGGCSYLPSAMVDDLIKQKQLFVCELPEQIHRPIYFSYHKNSPILATIEQLKNQLIEQ